MPVLVGKWYTKVPLVSCNGVSTTVQQDKTVQQDISPPKDVWCYCKQPEDDRAMIGCDYPECLIQWFHLNCLKFSLQKSLMESLW